jgi:serine phosphatase RsbU (regulator of sigma subunit)
MWCMHITNDPLATHFRSCSWLYGYSLKPVPASLHNLLMSRLAADLVDRIDSAWVLGVTQSDGLLDAVEAFAASEMSHLGSTWMDDLQHWRDCLKQHALAIKDEGGASALIAIGPKSRGRQYSHADLEFARDICGQIGNVLRRAARSLQDARREIESAQNIQDRLTPGQPPDVDGIECSGLCEHSTGSSGDFYDLLSPAAGELVTVIGNVAVQGVSGSILMTALKTLIRSLTRRNADLAELVCEINHGFWQTASSDAIAPLFASRVNSGGRTIDYVNAGHQTAFIVRADGHMERLERNGPPLGLNRQSLYHARAIRFQPGDLLIAASEGIVEATSPEGVELGEEGLLRIILELSRVRTRALPARIIEAVEAFAGKGGADRTVIAVGYREEEFRSLPLEMAATRPLAAAVAA